MGGRPINGKGAYKWKGAYEWEEGLLMGGGL